METSTKTPSTFSASSRRAALSYIQRVASGKQVAGRLVRLAVARHQRDLEASRFKKFPYRFDPKGPERVFRFFSYLCHYKGEFAGHQFALSPWQCFLVWALFGWVDAHGLRRYRIALISVAKKNGKTTFAAALGLDLFSADQEAGAEVFSVATKRDQARLSHKDAVQMAKRSPALAKRIEFFKDNLSISHSASSFVPLGSNVDTTDGLNVHGAIVDEVHRHKTRDLWDVIEYGTAARRQSLLLGITTAGREDGFCYELREHAAKVLEGTVEDASLFAFIAEPDEGDDDADPKTWIKGNPNLGVSVTRAQLAQEYAKAREMPSAMANFRRYRLNRWI
ncbi:MAG: terminase large subunit, partial [Gammaproteobacteria bacterium]